MSSRCTPLIQSVKNERQHKFTIRHSWHVGGVDSSVSAALLLEQGYQVSGVFMKNWEEDDDDECNAAKDLADTEEVCKTLGIKLNTVNFSYEYWERVFVGFLNDLKNGKTPNPDVICNVEIKFREFPQWAMKLGADYVATGHYARISNSGDPPQLLRAKDLGKDQTYFLYGIHSDSLKRTIFPVGAMTKEQVRKKAKQLGFDNHDKKGSTGICFIGRRNFSSFITRFVDSAEGEIVDSQGTVLGKHNGAFLYTIGQRTGLGIGGPGEPWYVADKDIRSNTVVVVQGHSHPMLFSRIISASQVNWIGSPNPLPMESEAKIRYQGHSHSCLVSPGDGNGLFVEFKNPVRAVTPGQSIVFYDGDICLGGAVIESTLSRG